MNYLRRNTRGMLCLTCIILTGTWFANATAGGVYESVDAEGNVTFSDTPPPGSTAVKEIDLPSEPTPAEVREGEQAEKNLENMATGMGGGDAAAPPQPAPPAATGGQPESGTAVEQEGGVYVEEGYPVRRYPEENVREGTGVGVENRRAPVGVSRPAARVR